MVCFGLDAGLMVTLLGVLSHFTVRASAAALPPDGNSALTAGDSNDTSYYLQSFVVNQKYHKTKPSFVSFTGGDGYVTESMADAAKFWIWGGQLGVGNQFVHLDFSNGYAVVQLDDRPSSGDYTFLYGQDGWLHVQGEGISYGEGSQAVFCQSEDGSLFLQGNGKPPFACQDIGLSPREQTGPAPRSVPPRQHKSGNQPQQSAIPTMTTTATPSSLPTWFAHQLQARSPQRGGGGRGGGGRGGGGRGGGGRGGGGRGAGGRGGNGRAGNGPGGPTRTRPNQPNPSSDNDAPNPFLEKRSFEFDMDGDIVE
ncbi:hypothetical protein AYL99_10615 [Fonsecaea erecta]|uniref:DUF7908 domain-containing protein n=1 Tax=Fonsecaea erecta TaxID=1367422 RepID=A0A178Z788_9EURO|nr:hypothetical protein AYL99_10615 [Fonsecaea erecta]OAP54915.1 hypothetical protein AYL99_10615 [Fonsecaea erecta]